MSSSIGGGISASESDINIFNNTIVNNTSVIGGGLHAYGNGSFIGYNNILWGNTAGNYSEFYGEVNLSYSACSEYFAGIGNIDDDPLFVNPDLDDYNLQSDSPCIDTGDPASPLDPDSTRADMGALYYNQLQSAKETSGNGIPMEFTLLPPHPNPFNQSTVISYELQAASHMELKVYDISGGEVAKLMDGYQNAGDHEVTFNAKYLVSGVYFVRLTVEGGQSMVRKIVLMK